MALSGGNESIPFKYTALGRVLEFFRLLYIVTANKARGDHQNALYSILLRAISMLTMVTVFFVLMSVTGLRDLTGRPDALLFLISGIFCFFIHIGSFKTGMGGFDPNDPMNLHAPITPLLMLFASAAGQLYTNIFAMGIITLAVHVLLTPVEIDNVRGVMNAFLWAWLSGLSIGALFSGIGTFIPIVGSIAPTLHRRLNMIFSGKMIAGNSIPPAILPFFLWNPLFHVIDQCRGAVFRNYIPQNTNPEYPIWFTLVTFLLALMLFHARKKLV